VDAAKNPRILVVTPEISALPDPSVSEARVLAARASGLGDVCAGLILQLQAAGADVHVAMPNYRNIFRRKVIHLPESEHRPRNSDCIHLVEDRAFYYPRQLLMDTSWDNTKIALAFQREVMHQVIPEVRPDLIHCHDWMTGLLPPLARSLGIPCLFTLYNLNTVRLPLAVIEERGIDAASFWQHCYYANMPGGYEQTREHNPADLLVSAVFAAGFVNTVSPAFMRQILDDRCHFITPGLKAELGNKYQAGCLASIAQAPAPHFDPATDKALYRRYDANDHPSGKAFNKLRLQEFFNLRMDSRAPLFFWPTRLGGGRRGCWLMASLLPEMLRRYAAQGLQLVFVADGDLHDHFRTLVHNLGAGDRVAVWPFDPGRQRLAFAAADFLLMPVQYEPCGMPCKIGQRYGALPVGHATGGVSDTVVPLDVSADHGNGFLFDTFDEAGLADAIHRAMAFHGAYDGLRARQIQRIMDEARHRDADQTSAAAYIGCYERLLATPLDHLRDALQPPAREVA
jgi:glycogen synthase